MIHKIVIFLTFFINSICTTVYHFYVIIVIIYSLHNCVINRCYQILKDCLYYIVLLKNNIVIIGWRNRNKNQKLTLKKLILQYKGITILFVNLLLKMQGCICFVPKINQMTPLHEDTLLVHGTPKYNYKIA